MGGATKNYEILSAFTLIFILSVFSQELSNIQGENDPVSYGTSDSKAVNCSQSNPSNAFEDGRGCSANNSWTVANDVIVAADESFMLRQIEANIMVTTGASFSNVDVFYYADNSGVPGTLLGSQLGVLPTSETVIGSAFGLDVKHVVLDVIPFTFIGQSGSAKTYWIGLQTTDSSGGNAFWEDTSASAVGDPLAFDDGTGYIIPDATLDGVYTFSGTCLTSCDYFNPSNAFESGYGCSPNNGWLSANDLIVPSNENFVLEQVVVNIWENESASITNVDITYYDDNAGIPDNQIGFQLGLTPTSQNVIGMSAGYDVHEVVLDITPFTFIGQVSIPTTYWIGLSVTNSAGGNTYWEYTTVNSVGNPLAFNNNGGGWEIPDPTQDGVYIYSGQCQGIGIAESIIDGFNMYPNPVEDLVYFEASNRIAAIYIYNLLGQEVMRNSPSNTEVQIDMSALPTGAYIVKVQAGNQVGSYSLIKQ